MLRDLGDLEVWKEEKALLGEKANKANQEIQDFQASRENPDPPGLRYVIIVITATISS